MICDYRIHCSEECGNLLSDIGGYVLEKRGCVNLKVSIDVFFENLANSLIDFDYKIRLTKLFGLIEFSGEGGADNFLVNK